MSKKVAEMTDAELIQAYWKGKGWLIRNSQVPKTKKNRDGKDYDPATYFVGVSRIEKIEEEMARRNIDRD